MYSSLRTNAWELPREARSFASITIQALQTKARLSLDKFAVGNTQITEASLCSFKMMQEAWRCVALTE